MPWRYVVLSTDVWEAVGTAGTERTVEDGLSVLRCSTSTLWCAKRWRSFNPSAFPVRAWYIATRRFRWLHGTQRKKLCTQALGTEVCRLRVLSCLSARWL